MNGGQQSDEELAQLAAGGDEWAFSDLYNRYFPEIFDYAIRMSRDRDIAALVLQSAFLRLYQLLQSGTPPPSVRLHLFAGAHHDLAERMRARRTAIIEGEEAFVVGDPARLERSISAQELHEQSRLIWQAVRELRQEDYELLDLSVRRALTDDEIASFMRVRSQSVHARLESARQTLEDSFSSLLIMMYGRRACMDLDFLVAEDKWSTSLRRRILQHAASCPVCQTTRRAYMSAAEALNAIAVVPAPPGWQAIMLSRLLKAREGGEPTPSGPLLPTGVPRPEPVPVAEAAAAPAVAVASTSPYTARPMSSYSSTPGMFERLPDFGGRGPLIAVFGGALLIVAMIFGALCSAGAFDGGSDDGGVAEGTTTVTRTATRTRTPTSTRTMTSTPTSPPEATETPLPTDVPPTEEPATNTPVPPTNTPVVVPTDTPPVETPVTTP
jgi:RNA polymerase sigma-70 factor (ECF subfamily)